MVLLYINVLLNYIVINYILKHTAILSIFDASANTNWKAELLISVIHTSTLKETSLVSLYARQFPLTCT